MREHRMWAPQWPRVASLFEIGLGGEVTLQRATDAKIGDRVASLAQEPLTGKKWFGEPCEFDEIAGIEIPQNRNIAPPLSYTRVRGYTLMGM